MSDKKSSMASKLPMVSARAFVAAARLGSFRDAAAYLGLSASAVSRHINKLEHWLGQPLFERDTRKVTLLPAGQQLAQELSAPFEQIEECFREFKEGKASSVRLTTLPFFANHWLIEQLGELPDGISLSINTAQETLDLNTGDLDVAIRNLNEPPVGLWSSKLLDLRSVPVCHPSMAQQIRTPQDLLKAPLIHLTARPGGWERWFTAQQVDAQTGPPALELDTLPAVLEAALQGQGVALGLSPIIWSSAKYKQLCVPFKCNPVHAGSYYLVMRKENRVRPNLQSFATWIKNRLAEQRHSMLRCEADATRTSPMSNVQPR